MIKEFKWGIDDIYVRTFVTLKNDLLLIYRWKTLENTMC